MRTESNSFELCRMQPMLNNHYFRAIRQNWLLTKHKKNCTYVHVPNNIGDYP